MSGFWRTWLKVWCGAVCVIGLVLAGAGLETTDGPARVLFAVLNGPGEPGSDAHFRFSTALMGAVTLGWGLTIYATIQAALQLGERGASIWSLLIGAMLIWFVIDSALSIATGFALNAVSNTLLLAGFLLPVLRSGVLQKTATAAQSYG